VQYTTTIPFIGIYRRAVYHNYNYLRYRNIQMNIIGVIIICSTYVFPQPPRHCSGASAVTLAVGRGRTTRACFLRWFPSAIPNPVVSSPAVPELYWGKKALHVCPKIPNLAPHLGRSSTLRMCATRYCACAACMHARAARARRSRRRRRGAATSSAE
jgi:hypothetical protein